MARPILSRLVGRLFSRADYHGLPKSEAQASSADKASHHGNTRAVSIASYIAWLLRTSRWGVFVMLILATGFAYSVLVRNYYFWLFYSARHGNVLICGHLRSV